MAQHLSWPFRPARPPASPRPPAQSTPSPSARPAQASSAKAVLAAVVLTGGVLGGCSNPSRGQAVQACRHVQRSLQLYAAAQDDPDPGAAAGQRASAVNQLRQALPLAALAATEDAQWNPLDYTLSESTRVPEANLVSALRQECSVAFSSPNQPPPPVSGPGKGP